MCEGKYANSSHKPLAEEAAFYLLLNVPWIHLENAFKLGHFS